MLHAVAAPWIDKTSLHARYRFLQSGLWQGLQGRRRRAAFLVREAAVMFADLRGFTQMAEYLPPRDVVALLQGFYGRMSDIVTRHGGSVEAFLGDGLMATFVEDDSGRAAANALNCAEAAFAAMADWNAERADLALPRVRLSVGLHHGDVVLSDVTGERHASVKTLGDVVNVASRLEKLTREIDCRAVVSDDLVDAARRHSPQQVAAMLADFSRIDGQCLRGRDRPLDVWVLPAR